MKDTLTAEERRLMRRLAGATWQSRGLRSRQHYVRLARQQRKEQRINIRLSSKTLQKLRADAVAEGLAYQTFIASVLYRYAEGRLHDVRYLQRAMALIRR